MRQPSPRGSRRARDERGATAILVAIMAMALLGIGAVAVDVGQVYAKRASLQSTVDLAVLAAAAHIDGSDSCTADARNAAQDYLTQNWIDQANDPISVDLGGVIGDDDGFIKCEGWTVKLWAPKAFVRYGLARAVMSDSGPEGVEVPAYAEAGVFSPEGVGFMPAYAAAGCDYGPQTLLENDPDTGGGPSALPHETEPDPTLWLDGITPGQIELRQPGTIPLVLTGGPALEDVEEILFSLEGADESTPHFEYRVPVANSVPGRVTFNNIPAEVRNTEGVWWVRVAKTTEQHWTPKQFAQPLVVGTSLLECTPDVEAGNFGQLTLGGDSDTALATNFAAGPSFTMAIHPNPAPGSCSPGSGGSVGPPGDGTNCVGASAGLPSEPTEAGLITGEGIGVPARLSKPTSPGCGSDVTVPTGQRINNDHLSCFLKPGATGSFMSAGYSGPSVVSADVFASPRFFWVPIIGEPIGSGGSGTYKIVDFRPAFITGSGPYNGFDFDSDTGTPSLSTMEVVFFNAEALPKSISTGEVTDYIGVGTKVFRLLD